MDTSADKCFEQYTHEVYGWAYRFLGAHHDALDVVQEVFLKWSEQFTTDAPRRPRGWLRRVTLNRVIDLQRRRRFEHKRDKRARRVVAAWTSDGQTIDTDDLRADIATALRKLTEIQRAVLVAKVYDTMTFAQIAAELDLAVSTVKTHYLRAVRALRNQLEPRWAE